MADNGTTTYRIEALRPVIVLEPDADVHTTAWLPVGAIEIENDVSYFADVFNAWQGEQTDPPPVGKYRVVQPTLYGHVFQTFEIFERTEREVRRVDPYPPAEVRPGVPPELAEALEVLADAASVRGAES